MLANIFVNLTTGSIWKAGEEVGRVKEGLNDDGQTMTGPGLVKKRNALNLDTLYTLPF